MNHQILSHPDLDLILFLNNFVQCGKYRVCFKTMKMEYSCYCFLIEKKTHQNVKKQCILIFKPCTLFQVSTINDLAGNQYPTLSQNRIL